MKAKYERNGITFYVSNPDETIISIDDSKDPNGGGALVSLRDLVWLLGMLAEDRWIH